MKKFFITIGVLVLALSVFGVYDTSQKKKEADKIAAETSMFQATIDTIEGDDEKKQVNLVATEDGNDDKVKGKKYSFSEDKVKEIKVFDETNKEIKFTDLKAGNKIAIQHIGKIKKGDISELTGKISIVLINENKEKPEEEQTTESLQETEPTK